MSNLSGPTHVATTDLTEESIEAFARAVLAREFAEKLSLRPTSFFWMGLRWADDEPGTDAHAAAIATLPADHPFRTAWEGAIDG